MWTLGRTFLLVGLDWAGASCRWSKDVRLQTRLIDGRVRVAPIVGDKHRIGRDTAFLCPTLKLRHLGRAVLLPACNTNLVFGMVGHGQECRRALPILQTTKLGASPIFAHFSLSVVREEIHSVWIIAVGLVEGRRITALWCTRAAGR